jgi:hypothetical protein
MTRHALAVAFFAVLACAFSYPLVLNLPTHVPGPPGDNFAFVWNFWWFRHALASGTPLFECSHLFAPMGVSLVLDTHMALQSMTGATILAKTSIVTAHNVVLLAGLALNGIATYALAYAQVRRAMPAVLAGVIFSTCAYIGLHFLGHFNLVHAWVLPAAALAWMRFVDRPSMISALTVAVAFAVLLYSDYYYFVFALLFAVIWFVATEWHIAMTFGASKHTAAEWILLALMGTIAVAIAIILATGGVDLHVAGSRLSIRGVRNPTTALWVLFLAWLWLRSRFVVRRRSDPRLGGVIRNLGWAAAAGAVLALPLATAAASLVSAGDYVAPMHRWRSNPGGIDMLALVAGNPMHAIYGGVTTRLFDTLRIGLIDQAAWIGLVPIIVVLSMTRARPRLQFEYRPWVIVGLFFFVWSAGPFLQVAGRATGIMLPQFFARFVPLLSNARIPGRGFVMVMLAAAVLCAFAVAELRWRPNRIGALIGLAFIDGLVAPFPLSPIPAASRIEQFLATDPRPGSVMTIPTGYQDGFAEVGRFDASTLLHQIHHQRPIVGGYVSRVPERIKRIYQDRAAIAQSIALSSPDATSGALPGDFDDALAEDGIAFVVVDRAHLHALPAREDLIRRGLTLAIADGDRELYVVGER